MERIWIKHWPPGLEQSRIRLPKEPLPVFLKANARRAPPPACGYFVLQLTESPWPGGTAESHC